MGFGARYPAIFVCPGTTSLHIVHDNTQSLNFHCSVCTRILQLDVWYLIEIYAVGNTLQNFIDGELDQSCTTGGERPPQKVRVYASSRFFKSTDAVISDLVYEDLAGQYLDAVAAVAYPC